MEILKKEKWDKMLVGLLTGIIGAGIGFVIYGIYYSFRYGISFNYFVNNVFLGNRSLIAPIISLSLLFNILPFYFYINRNFYRAGRGIILSFFVFALVIIYFRFL
jgi:hypothetical protein